MVHIQNLLGNNHLRWDRTGIMVQVKQFDQYRVKVDGTGRLTFRNRRNLRLIGQKLKENQDHITTRVTNIQRISPLNPPRTIKPVIRTPSPIVTRPMIPSEPATQSLRRDAIMPPSADQQETREMSLLNQHESSTHPETPGTPA